MFCIGMAHRLAMRVSYLLKRFDNFIWKVILILFNSCVEQIQNPIHFEKIGDGQFTATIKASESFSVCCGRNIAFISEIPTGQSNTDTSNLNALTWIDPVTTEVVEVKRRLTDIDDMFGARRRLSDRKKRSAIHGTNGYLVPLHSTNELLGMAHFHRPEHRDSSDYARHGHHYSEYIYYF